MRVPLKMHIIYIHICSEAIEIHNAKYVRKSFVRLKEKNKKKEFFTLSTVEFGKYICGIIKLT